MNFQKNLILISLSGLLRASGFFGGTLSLADEQVGIMKTLLGDCLLVTEQYTKNNHFSIINNRKQNRQQNIVDQPALNVAFLNLKKVCCDQLDNRGWIYCKEDWSVFNENVPQSYYLFDHLLDVLIRRLDGDKNNIYPNLTLDSKGEERRTFTNEVVTATDGTPVQNITKQYTTFRDIKGNNKIERGLSQEIDKSRDDYITPTHTWAITTGKNLEILKNYEKRTLGERYDNICDITRYLYLLFTTNSENIKTTQTVLFENRCEGQTNACNCLIEQRKNAENIYAQTLTNKGNTLLANNIKQYVNVYLDKRLFDFQTTMQSVSTTFLRITKAIEKLVPICTS